LLRFSYQSFVWISVLPHALHMSPPSHSPLFVYPNILRAEKIIKLVIILLSAACCSCTPSM
jgi:hypothetical protein